MGLAATLAAATAATAQVGFGYDGIKFLQAVREGDGAKATQLAESSGPAVVNYRGTDGDAGIHIAARLRSYNWLGYLLQKGADPNLAGRNGETALIIASRIGFPEGAEKLLREGADINRQDKLGETALIAAVQQRQPRMVELLLRKGADPAKQDRVGNTARDYAKRETRYPELLRLIDSVKPSGASKLIQ
jgi:ankyrin repeat protein